MAETAGPWHRGLMGYTRDSVPDQSGRTVVVTGANGGLGLETAKVLAARGAHVVMAARDQAKAQRAVEVITGAERLTVPVFPAVTLVKGVLA